MKKAGLILLLFLSVFLLYGGEEDDLRFIVGLYKDSNFSLARTELISFIKNYPESSHLNTAKFLLANIYQDSAKYQDAIKLFKELEQGGADPKIKPDIYFGLGQCYFLSNDLKTSENYLRLFTLESPNHRLVGKAFYYLSRICYQKENYTAALKYLERVDEKEQDWAYKIAKIQVLSALDMNSEAEAVLGYYLQSKEHNEYVHQMLSIYLNHLLVAKHYRKLTTYALDYIPYNSQYYDNYLLIVGEALCELGDHRSALERFEAVTESNERKEYLSALCYIKLDKQDRAETILNRLKDKAVNIEIKTNSLFFLAGLKGDKDPKAANRMLNEFITSNPKHPFIGAAYYQLGINNFKSNAFDEAIDYFEKALKAGLDHEFEEKATFLLAESYFQINKEDESTKRYQQYVNKYPKGEFIDEALFKLGLAAFEKSDYANALVKFDQIIKDFRESNRLSMAMFYKAEIFSKNNQDDLALDLYKQASNNFENVGLISLRLAQINFKLGKYDQALSELENIPNTKEYRYEKEVVRGNVYYAKKNYTSALKSFKQATEFSQSNAEWEDSLIRQARTLYQLKDYRESTNIYKQVYDKLENEQHLFSAATVSFTGEDYRRAIELFSLFVKKYPNSNDINKAQLHLADSYYNNKDYDTATQRYLELIRPGIDSDILLNSLNGLEWSASQGKKSDFVKLLNQIDSKGLPEDFKITLLKRKADYFYTKGMWNDVVNAINELTKTSISKSELRDYRKLLGIAMTNLRRYIEAEEIFKKLQEEKQDPSVLIAWSRLHLAENDSLAAYGKLKQAANLTKDTQTWLDMLTLAVSIKDDDFIQNYDKFMKLAKNSDREQGMLLLVRWYFLNDDFITPVSILEDLLNSNFETIKAKAQYYKGVRLYKLGRASEAIPELLRVRYLYPRIEDVRLDAEILAVQAYLEQGEKTNALKIFDGIRNDLSPQQRKELSRSLGLED